MVNLHQRLAVVRAGQERQLLSGSLIFDTINLMKRREKMIPKKRGRPATGQGKPVVVRMQPGDLVSLDKYRTKLDGKPTRPEAIRRIVAQFLKARAQLN
jgi:hypothetical protein